MRFFQSQDPIVHYRSLSYDGRLFLRENMFWEKRRGLISAWRIAFGFRDHR